MSSSRVLLAAAAALLLLLVPIAMCVGLSDEPPPRRSTSTPSDDDLDETEADLEQVPAPEPPYDDEAPEVDEEPEQGVRTLSGQVTDARGDPIAEAEVMIDGFGRLRDFSDEHGEFSLRSVPTEPVTLVVAAPGYRESRMKVAQGVVAQDETHDVQLQDGNEVAGVVVDPEGRPLQGAKVGCSGQPDRDAATSDRTGRFLLPQSAAGCAAVARHDRFSDSPEVTMAAGPRNLIALAALGAIRGMVVDGAGKPLTRFVITIESAIDADGKPMTRSYRQSFNHPEGRFTVSNLPAGRYVLSVSAGSGNPVLAPPITVERGVQGRPVQITVR